MVVSGPKVEKDVPVFLCSDPTPGVLTHVTVNLSQTVQVLSAITVMLDGHYYSYKAGLTPKDNRY